MQARGYSFVTLDALRTPGNWGDEVNPFSNGFNVLHQRQAVNAIIASWPASKADPAVHFLRIPGTVPGAYRFDYAPNGVATGPRPPARVNPGEKATGIVKGPRPATDPFTGGFWGRLLWSDFRGTLYSDLPAHDLAL